MKIVFFGPPGSGKGTYSSAISEKLKIPHISTGDIFRSEMAEGTPLGNRIREGMDKGVLVDDKTTNELVKKRLAAKDCKKGYILDGYPRTMDQGKFLEKISKTDVVINLVLDNALIIKKTIGRRMCPKCRAIYNVAHIKHGHIDMPPLLPKKEGICDKCGTKLVQRPDDKEAVVKDRIKVYEKQSKPLLEYYRKKNLVKNVDVVGNPGVMVPKILAVIRAK